MCRLSLVLFLLLVVSAPTVGQTKSTDSQTLQALLTEVQQLRQDLQAMTAVAHKTQVLLYRLQAQDTTLVRLSRSADDAHAEVNQLEAERAKMVVDIKQHEDFISNTSNASGDRKVAEDALVGLKDELQSLDDQLEQAHNKESTAKEQLRSENARLDRLEAEFETLERKFETGSDEHQQEKQ